MCIWIEIFFWKFEATCTLPPGCTIAICPMPLHLDENIYPNPMKFDPENFTEENCKKRHPFAFLPFSGGPRGCIGKIKELIELFKIFIVVVVYYYVKDLYFRC